MSDKFYPEDSPSDSATIESDAPAAGSQFDRRLMIVVMAGLIIAGVTWWRMENPRHRSDAEIAVQLKRPAPAFRLYEQGAPGTSPKLVNLDAYLHRHTIVLVFYDGEQGPEEDALLVQLREFYPALKRENVVVFGVSTALPQENRQRSIQPFPFPLLSDVTASEQGSVHRTWGRLDESRGPDGRPRTKPGVFVIDRAGLVAWEGDFPLPDPAPETLLSRLLSGR